MTAITTMTPFVRKLALLGHITFSVGWLGAVVAYLGLAIGGLAGPDPQLARAAYLWMEPIGWFVIVPLSVAAMLSGLVQSLGTRWGLFRHWRVVAKSLLTILATVVLLRHMEDVSRGVRTANGATWSTLSFRPELIHAGGGLLVLLAATALSVFKPWGVVPWARPQMSPTRISSRPAAGAASVQEPAFAAGQTRWRLILGMHAILFVALVALFHLSGLHHHG